MLAYREDWVRPAWLQERLPPGSVPRDPWNPYATREDGGAWNGQGPPAPGRERLPHLLEVEAEGETVGSEASADELVPGSVPDHESPPGLLGAASEEKEEDDEDEEVEEEEDESAVAEDAPGEKNAGSAALEAGPRASPASLEAPRQGATQRSAAWRLNAAQELVTQHDLDRVANEIWVRWLRAPRASLESCFQSIAQHRADLNWKVCSWVCVCMCVFWGWVGRPGGVYSELCSAPEDNWGCHMYTWPCRLDKTTWPQPCLDPHAHAVHSARGVQGIMHALEAMSIHFVVDRPLLASIQSRILADLDVVGNNVRRRAGWGSGDGCCTRGGQPGRWDLGA